MIIRHVLNFEFREQNTKNKQLTRSIRFVIIRVVETVFEQNSYVFTIFHFNNLKKIQNQNQIFIKWFKIIIQKFLFFYLKLS